MDPNEAHFSDGGLDTENKHETAFYFAPMEGITGYPFRNAHRDFFPGIDRYFSPFLVTNQNLSFKKKELRDVAPENNRDLTLVPQLLSNQSESFVHAVRMLAGMGYREVNLNLGCPSPTVVSRHRGAGMLADPDRLDSFFEAVFDGLSDTSCAISVKTRVGLTGEAEMQALLAVYNRYPLSELIVHPRLREDYYRGAVRMETFSRIYEESTHPVCYNGDLKTVEEIRGILKRFPGLSAVMIGRGLVADPSLVRQFRDPRQKLEKEELRAFLNRLFLNYRVEMASDFQTMCKMKEIWSFLANRFPGSEKTMKKLRKAKHPDDYEAFLEEIFRGDIEQRV